MASAVILQVEKDAAAKIEPLLTTTDQTQRIPIEQLEQKPPKIKEIAQNFEPSGKVMMLGARLSGVVKRSEEHTSELQSLMRISYAVFCLKKKKHNNTSTLVTQ